MVLVVDGEVGIVGHGTARSRRFVDEDCTANDMPGKHAALHTSCRPRGSVCRLPTHTSSEQPFSKY